MPRIFASLAIATLTLFALTAAFALLNTGLTPDRHILLGIGTLLLCCFNQVVGFTYLTVTGKVIAQAAHLANLDPACLASARQYKRTFTRLLAVAIVSLVFASATGGAAWRSRDVLAFHLLAAMIAALIHVWVYGWQIQVLRRNADLVERTVKAYSLRRPQRISGDLPPPTNADSKAPVP